jgi:hypothetical protein
VLDPNCRGDAETVATGPFFALPFEGVEAKAGFFKWKRKWYAASKNPGEPMKLVHLKGTRGRFRNGWGVYLDTKHWIKLSRTPNAKNIEIQITSASQTL